MFGIVVNDEREFLEEAAFDGVHRVANPGAEFGPHSAFASSVQRLELEAVEVVLDEGRFLEVAAQIQDVGDADGHQLLDEGQRLLSRFHRRREDLRPGGRRHLGTRQLLSFRHLESNRERT